MFENDEASYTSSPSYQSNLQTLSLQRQRVGVVRLHLLYNAVSLSSLKKEFTALQKKMLHSKREGGGLMLQ